MIIDRDKFFKRVNLFHGITDEDCWEWTGSRDKDGYGKFNVRGANGKWTWARAHRVFWLLFKGEIPEGKIVCHSCDWPPCVNGSHLFLSDWQGNVDDMMAKGRQNHVGCPKLTEEQVLEMRRAKVYRGIQKFYSEKFGVTNSVISDVFNYVSFKHIVP